MPVFPPTEQAEAGRSQIRSPSGQLGETLSHNKKRPGDVDQWLSAPVLNLSTKNKQTKQRSDAWGRRRGNLSMPNIFRQFKVDSGSLWEGCGEGQGNVCPLS